MSEGYSIWLDEIKQWSIPNPPPTKEDKMATKKRDAINTKLGCCQNRTGILVDVKAVELEKSHAGIMDILQSRNDQETIRVALKAFESSIKAPDVTISDCHIVMGEEK